MIAHENGFLFVVGLFNMNDRDRVWEKGFVPSLRLTSDVGVFDMIKLLVGRDMKRGWNVR